MSIVVYYLLPDGNPAKYDFNDDEMTKGLDMCQELRNAGFSHVTMVTQLSGQVGGMGVSAVKDGLLPDGSKYEWSKAHRAGAKPQK